ncbi:MAG: DUF1343 domain-containing protein [Gammaproteobacteria bacterium]|nr:DUF1343 domain-containing protein [Gammaproteobacteria bacterium]
MKLWLSFVLLATMLFTQYSFGKQVLPTQVGAEQTEQYLTLLKGKRIGLVVNQTSRVNEQHIVDFLVSKKQNIATIFAVEHGFRGDHDAGAKVSSSVDAKTGIKIHSIYGKNKKPSSEVMNELDVIIFDIQDVGVRFYTYINSMFYMMQAAAQNNVPFIVLDRPNPHLSVVDGPMLNPEFSSFVGLLPVPLVHGMTVGELAQMIQGEGWLNSIDNADQIKHKLTLTVVPVKDYQRNDSYVLPVLPSPNLPNQQAINLYPSLCFFEATPISIGRGTDFPFQVVGHNEAYIGEFAFTPRSIIGAASNPKLKGIALKGLDLRSVQLNGFDMSIFYDWFKLFEKSELEFFSRSGFMDKLAGTDQIRLDMLAGKTLEQIKQPWQNDLKQFKKQRAPYLIYK